MSRLWGLLNSQQIAVTLPMLGGLKFPANAITAIEFIYDIVTFDFISTENVESEVYYWPETDPFTTNFEMAGVESIFFLANIGFALYLIYLNLFAALVHACICRCRRSGRCISWLHAKLKAYLYWEGLHRF